MENSRIEVLIVDPDASLAGALRESLSALTVARVELFASPTLGEAILRLSGHRYDALLLNLFLPDSRGIATYSRINSQAPGLPVVVLTGAEAESLGREAVRLGAQDYLVRPRLDGKIFSRVIRYAIEKKRAERRLAAQHAVTRVLAESTSLAEATPRILQAVGESLDWETGAFWKVDVAQNLLRCVALWHCPAFEFREFAAASRRATFARNVGLPGRVWEGDKPCWTTDLPDDPNFPRAAIAAREGLRTALAFPVKIDQEILGVIEFFSRRIQPADADLLRMLPVIGSQTGQFIVRKEAEEALAEERNLLRTLIDALPDAIYVKDTQSRFILGNRGVAKIMGAAGAEELVGKCDHDFHPPDLAARYREDERALLNSGQPMINHEEPVIARDGGKGWLLTTKAPLRDTRGKIIGLVGIGRDITERKREEEEHRMTEARLQAILDNTTAVIYLKDAQGRYSLINRQFEELFHVDRHQVRDKTDYDLFPPEMARAFQINDCKVLESKTALEFEEVAPHDNEIRTYISIKFPLWDADGPCAVCGISTDITERKRMERKLVEANAELLRTNRELARSEDVLRKVLADLRTSHEQLKATQLQLIQAEKMESVGTLAAGVAHEVKNPLQTILMGLAYLNRNIGGGDEIVTSVLVDMHDAVKRADAIVRDLLYLSAPAQVEMQVQDLNRVLEHSLCLVHYELTRARITVKREFAPGLPGVPVDRARMEQVLINLFMNAIHAMPEGGLLTVRSICQKARAGAPDELISACHPVVTVEIEDTGVGIPKEKLPRIFEPFFTTKPSGVGTGLGLPVTKQIIDLHGGSIEIQAGASCGVRVTLKLKAETGGKNEPETNPDSGRRNQLYAPAEIES